MSSKIKLSVLDQSLIPKGGDAREAIHNTVETAQLAERLGYTRFWVSEHHNMASVAGSSPEVLLVKIGDATERIRIGSGGIMLPNHSTLKVAENFRLLEALFPGRIDLGIGRAPGGDRITAHLLNPSNTFSEDSYTEQLDYLQHFFKDEAATQYGRILAVPQVDTAPAQWMLSSTGGSSKIAAKYGMGLAVARFINGNAQPETVQIYKTNFVPSELFPEPQAALSLVVLCAETEEKALQLRKSVEYQIIQMEKGIFEGISHYDLIKDYEFTPMELQRIAASQGRFVAGTPHQVKQQLTRLAEDFGVDEIIVVTWVARQEDRVRSLELLAEAFELAPELSSS